MSRIELRSLTKNFGKNRALDAVDLTIDDGEFVVFLGPSGCGKSTLLRMIAGLSEPTSGAIAIDGRDVTGAPPRDRGLAMVFQSYALYPHLSVAKNIGFPLRTRRVRRADITEKVERVAATLQLSNYLKRRPSDLSGGQRQRVALARAMVQEPGAYLMDEPLSNLDARLRSATRTELIDLHQRIGSTFLYVTHDQVEAMTMATRIVLLNEGRIEQVGTPDDLYDRPQTSFVATFLGAPAMCLFDAEARVDAARVGGARADDARLTLQADGVSIPLDLRCTEPGFAQPVTAGVRPERVRIVRDRDDVPPRGGAAIPATVQAIENLGSDEIVHFRAATTALQARVPRPCGAAVGDTVYASIDPRDIHLFSPDSGVRLHWETPRESFDSTPDLQISDSRTSVTTLISQGAPS
ncbi:ABC transporter [Nocardia farcinica]|nr:ABC transporter [Nocardia farcinica]